MAEIHRKASLIKKRMTHWKIKGKSEPKPKKKSIHFERLKEGGKVIGGAIWGGLKKVGKSLADPKTRGELYEFGQRAGGSSKGFFETGFDEPRRKSKTKKKRR